MSHILLAIQYPPVGTTTNCPHPPTNIRQSTLTPTYPHSTTTSRLPVSTLHTPAYNPAIYQRAFTHISALSNLRPPIHNYATPTYPHQLSHRRFPTFPKYPHPPTRSHQQTLTCPHPPATYPRHATHLLTILHGCETELIDFG
jgi:hypothetical protein